MNTTKHCFILLIAALALIACEDAATKKAMSFPEWPKEEVYVYDTVDCRGLDIPAGAITVKKALEIGKTLASGKSTDEKYYIKGLIKKFETKSGQNHEEAMGKYGNAYMYIQDNTKTNQDFYGFRVMNSFNTTDHKFTSLDQLKVGDFVVIYTTIKNYNNLIETGDNPLITFSTNELVYPEKDVQYFTEKFAVWPGNWTIDTQSTSDPTFSVWKQNVNSKTKETSAIAQAQNGTTKFASEVWLKSPAINLSQHQPKSVKLAFGTYYKKDSKDSKSVDVSQYLKLQISRDGVNWESIPFKQSGGTVPTYVNDTIDITAYVSASTYIAFAYKSTADYAPKWNINNISIFEHKRGK